MINGTMENISLWKLLVFSVFLIFFMSIFIKVSSRIWKLLRSNMSLMGLPNPPVDNWLNGHAAKLTNDMDMINWLRSVHQYGKLQRWRIGYENNAVATHPDTARILLNASCNKHVVVWDVIRPYLGDSLLTGAGQKWYRNRKLLTPVFHFNVLQTYVSPMQEGFQQIAGIWNEKIEKSVEVFEDVNATTMHCLIKIAFGDTGLTEQEIKTLKTSIDQILALWFKRITDIHQWNDFIHKHSQNGRKFYKLLHTIHNLGNSVMNNCREKVADESKKNGYLSFIELLLKAKDEDGKGLSDREILDEVHTFLFAGQDTVGSAIPYCLYHMARHPEYQEKCRDEIIDICGVKGDIKWDDLTNLTFLTMCIKESLRITGPVSMISRRLEKDVQLDENTTLIKGCPVWIILESVHHNPTVWKDPDVFNPQRFASEEAEQRYAHAFIPFSSGPRNCIGQAFAMTEIKVAMVVFLRKFRFHLDPSKPLVQTFPLLRSTKDGMWFKMEQI